MLGREHTGHPVFFLISFPVNGSTIIQTSIFRSVGSDPAVASKLFPPPPIYNGRKITVRAHVADSSHLLFSSSFREFVELLASRIDRLETELTTHGYVYARWERDLAFDYSRAASPGSTGSRGENISGIKWRPGEKNRFDTAHRAPLTNRSRTSWHSQNFNSYPSTPERTIRRHSGIVSTRGRRRAAIVCLYVYVAVTKSLGSNCPSNSARYGSLPCDSLSRWISTRRAIPRNHQPGKQVKPSPSPFPLSHSTSF